MQMTPFRVLTRRQALPDRRFELLKHFVSDWEGISLDSDGLIRVINPEGNRPPLIWCFNAQEEMPVLAAGLGENQPVIGMRSLNMVERPDGRRLSWDEALADYYTGLLLGLPGLDGCAVGGNCQGASIAVRVAANLRLAGKKVDTLITMEAQSVYPFPGRVALIFGERSEMFNPFLRNEAPQEKWDALFAEWGAYVIPGGHGQYFTAENGPELCRVVSEILHLPPQQDQRRHPATLRVSASLAYVPTKVKVASEASLPIVLEMDGDDLSSFPDSVAIRTVWKSTDHGIFHADDQKMVSLPAKSGTAQHIVPAKAPDQPGVWDLYIFVCSRLDGPISWAANYFPKTSIVIEAY